MPDDPTPAFRFSDFIKEFGEGALDDELTAALVNVTSAVRLHGKTGAVVLELKFAEKGGGVIVDADVAKSAPSTKPSSFFYVDETAGRLSRRDPRQPQLPLTNRDKEDQS
jgi:hypothetical protein